MIAARGDLKEQVLARITDFSPWFRDVKNQKSPGSGGWVSGRCPFHDDGHNSFSYDPSSGGWTCFSGCGSGDFFGFLQAVRGADFRTVLRDLSEQLGIADSGGKSRLSPGAVATDASRALDNEPARLAWLRDQRGLSDQTIRTAQLGWDRISGRYTIPVQDESGKVVNVRQYGPGQKPKMLNLSGHGSPARLYGIAELVRRGDEPVVVCEGELDCLLLRQHGFLAVTGTAGVGHFPGEWAAHLRGRDVAIIFDADNAGRGGAVTVAAKLLTAEARQVKIVQLPVDGTPEDKDVTDYFLKHGGSAADLRQIILRTPPNAKAQPLSTIQLNDRQQRDIQDEAWQAVNRCNDPPHLFVQAGNVVRIFESAACPFTEIVTEPYFRTVLHRSADWVKVNRSGVVANAKPPRDLASEMLARPTAELPDLEGIVTAPVFTACGRLAAVPGYDRDAQLWIHCAPGLERIHLDPRPSADAVGAARELLFGDLLVDFPFAAQSDRAHAVAAIILPFVRRLIPGCTPLHLIEATTPGSGKTLLADLVSLIATGTAAEPTTLTSNEEEARKKITAVLMRGSPLVLIDNVRDELGSAQLACALTADVWRDRLLSQSKLVALPNTAVWLVTANNPRLSEEIVRRSVRIRIEPAQERPWEQRAFKHQHIRQWTRDNRVTLITAVLTLVQAWIAGGRPKGSESMGSFEEWAEVMGGILSVAKVDGFLEGREQFYEAADTEGQQWRAFVETWQQELQSQPVTVGQLLKLAEDRDLISFAIAGRTPHAQRVKLGNALGQIRDRRFGDVQIRASEDRHTKGRIYRLCQVQDSLPGMEAAR